MIETKSEFKLQKLRLYLAVEAISCRPVAPAAQVLLRCLQKSPKKYYG